MIDLGTDKKILCQCLKNMKKWIKSPKNFLFLGTTRKK